MALLVALGALWSCTFAPLQGAPFQLLILAGIAGLLQSACPVATPRAALRWFGMAWMAAWSMFAVGVCWLYISLHEFGGVPAPMAVFAVLALAAYMALYPAIAFAVQARVVRLSAARRRAVFLQALAFGALWTATEWLRAWVFTGFPWLTTGEAWLDTPLAGWYPLLGSYGVGFVVAVAAWLLAAALPFLPQPRLRLTLRLPSLALFGIWAAIWGGAGVWLDGHAWGERPAAPVTVHLVQPNVSQTIKFDPEHITRNFMDTVLLGRMAAESAEPGDWLLFPETALPVLWQEAPQAWRNAFAAVAYEYQTHVVMGAALQDGEVYTNSVIALSPDSHLAPEMPEPHYDKRHLVPFGEFIPWGFRWFVDLMNMPMGDFNRGVGTPISFDLKGVRLLPNVCYEDVFSHEFAALVSSATPEPQVLFNVSNLAWFGGSWALEQHAQMSRVRAAEHRKPMLRATNTGVSGVIDARGSWVLKLPVNQRLSGRAEVVGMTGLTPYARWGLGLVTGLVSLLLVVAFALTKPANVQ